VLLPKAFDATNCTLYEPGVLYVTVGLETVDVEGVPPAKVHVFKVGEPVLKFVNTTVCPGHTVVLLAVKLAVGAPKVAQLLAVKAVIAGIAQTPPVKFLVITALPPAKSFTLNTLFD
jgi:hypothetical protein